MEMNVFFNVLTIGLVSLQIYINHIQMIYIFGLIFNQADKERKYNTE